MAATTGAHMCPATCTSISPVLQGTSFFAARNRLCAPLQCFMSLWRHGYFNHFAANQDVDADHSVPPYPDSGRLRSFRTTS